jgi:hypothetical protein
MPYAAIASGVLLELAACFRYRLTLGQDATIARDECLASQNPIEIVFFHNEKAFLGDRKG